MSRALNQEEIDKTRVLFKEAESRLKSAEHLTDKVFIPAVNELRYAGYHLVGYLSSEGDDDDIRSAQKHCKRAIYDAAEGPLLKFLGDVAQFQNDYSKVACITEVMPDYVAFMKKVQEARNLVAEVQPESRDTYFERIEPHLDTLKEVVGLLDSARPEINKRIRRDRNSTRLTSFLAIVARNWRNFCGHGPNPNSDIFRFCNNKNFAPVANITRKQRSTAQSEVILFSDFTERIAWWWA